MSDLYLRALLQNLIQGGSASQEDQGLLAEVCKRVILGGVNFSSGGTLNLPAGSVSGTSFTLGAGNLILGNAGASTVGKLTDAYVSATAAIAYTKLALTGSVVDADIANAAAIAWSKLSKTGSNLTDIVTRLSTDLKNDNTLCQGRLTLSTGTPVADVTAGTTIFFTPYKGNQVSLYNGATWDTVIFAEKSIAVPATTNTMYDVFVFSNAGVATLELLAWTNDTTRATAIVLQDGVYCKTGVLTRRYLGSFRTGAVAGQVADTAQNRNLYNHYNRVRRSLNRVETTATWTYTTATFRQANAAAANQVTVVVGVAEPVIDLEVKANASNTSTSINTAVAIGENSTSAPATGCVMQVGTTAVVSIATSSAARLVKACPLGYSFYAWLEFSVATGTTTWFGTAGVAYIQNGLVGSIDL